MFARCPPLGGDLGLGDARRSSGRPRHTRSTSTTSDHDGDRQRRCRRKAAARTRRRPAGAMRVSRHRNARRCRPSRTRCATSRNSGVSRMSSVRSRGKIVLDHVDDAPRPRRHDDDPGRQEHRFRDRVGDEHHRLARSGPRFEKLLVELVAHDLIERAERLVHEQQLGIEGRARGRSRRAAACRPTAARETCCSKPFRLTSSRLRASALAPLGGRQAHDLERQRRRCARPSATG